MLASISVQTPSTYWKRMNNTRNIFYISNYLELFGMQNEIKSRYFFSFVLCEISILVKCWFLLICLVGSHIVVEWLERMAGKLQLQGHEKSLIVRLIFCNTMEGGFFSIYWLWIHQFSSLGHLKHGKHKIKHGMQQTLQKKRQKNKTVRNFIGIWTHNQTVIIIVLLASQDKLAT